MSRSIVALTLAAIACGHEESKGPVADPAAFLAQVRVAECEHLTRCGSFETLEDCLAYGSQDRWRRFRFDPRVLDGVARGTVRYSPSLAGECLDAIRDRSCSRFAKDRAAPLCDVVLDGTIPAGDVSAYPFECTSQGQAWLCDPPAPDACCAAPCAEPVVAKDRGEPCDLELERCRDGLACRGGVCGAPVARGDWCLYTGECAGDLICGPRARCADAGSYGDSCAHLSELRQCEHIGTECGKDLRCRRLGRVGEVCDGKKDFCALGLGCDREQGRCVGLAAEGQPCQHLFQGPWCETGLYCGGSSPTCRRPGPDGDECSNSDGHECASGYCDLLKRRCKPLPVCT